MNNKIVGGCLGVLALGVLFVIAVIAVARGRTPAGADGGIPARSRQPADLFRAGNIAYESGDKAEAVRLYKEWLVLTDDGERYKDAMNHANTIRKVVEYELAYGDPMIARDWITRGVDSYGINRLLTMESPEGKALLGEVRSALKVR